MSMAEDTRVNVPVPFPTLVQGFGPVTLGKKNGVWNIGLSYSSILQASPPQANWPTDLVLVWDSIAQTFVTVPLSALAAGASGILPPTPTVLGGVFSNAGAASKWIKSINTDGSVTLSQPNYTDIVGTPPSAPLAPPALGVLGGVFPNAGAANKWISAINTDGSVTLTQPSFSNISGSVAAAQMPLFTSLVSGAVPASGGGTTNFLRADGSWASVGSASITPPAPAVLGGVFSNAGAANKWISAINTDGSVTLTQPAAANISGLGYFATGTDAANLTGTINNARLSAIPNSALANSSITISGHVVSLGGSLALANTDVSGLGTFATQNFATPPSIGGTTPAAGAFTTLNATGIVSLTNATASTLNNNGALVVTGGVGIGGILNVGSNAGSLASPIPATTNIVFYNQGAGNWAGIGAYTSGDAYIRAGITATGHVLAVLASNALSLLSGTGDATWNFGPSVNGGNAFFVYNNASVGVYLLNGSTSWTSTSDIRLKTIKDEITDAVASINNLRAVRYVLKNDPEQKIRVGVIAQEVQQVLPEIVSVMNDKDQTLGVEYERFAPLFIAGFKEIDARLTAVEASMFAKKQH